MSTSNGARSRANGNGAAVKAAVAEVKLPKPKLTAEERLAARAAAAVSMAAQMAAQNAGVNAETSSRAAADVKAGVNRSATNGKTARERLNEWQSCVRNVIELQAEVVPALKQFGRFGADTWDTWRQVIGRSRVYWTNVSEKTGKKVKVEIPQIDFNGDSWLRGAVNYPVKYGIGEAFAVCADIAKVQIYLRRMTAKEPANLAAYLRLAKDTLDSMNGDKPGHYMNCPAVFADTPENLFEFCNSVQSSAAAEYRRLVGEFTATQKIARERIQLARERRAREKVNAELAIEENAERMVDAIPVQPDAEPAGV